MARASRATTCTSDLETDDLQHHATKLCNSYYPGTSAIWQILALAVSEIMHEGRRPECIISLTVPISSMWHEGLGNN